MSRPGLTARFRRRAALFDPGAQHHIEDHHVWFTDGKFHMLFKDMTNAIRPIR